MNNDTMNTLTYKGYSARVEFDGRDNILVGHVADIADIIGFHAESVTELRAAFEEAVDDYLEACAKRALEPDKPASGRLMLRVDPSIHAAALKAAKRERTSLNQWAARVLAEAAHAGRSGVPPV